MYFKSVEMSENVLHSINTFSILCQKSQFLDGGGKWSARRKPSNFDRIKFFLKTKVSQSGIGIKAVADHVILK